DGGGKIMVGKSSVWSGLVAILLALLVPLAGRASHEAAEDGSEAPNYYRPQYYSHLIYWFPNLHRCLTRHRPTIVSVYPPNDYPDIAPSYIHIHTPNSVIPRPWHPLAEEGVECTAAETAHPQ